MTENGETGSGYDISQTIATCVSNTVECVRAHALPVKPHLHPKQ